MKLPEALQNLLSHILNEEYEDFINALSSDPTTSIHINTSKYVMLNTVTPQIVPWHKEGRFLTERPAFQSEPIFQAGGYYVQESSSMFLAEAIRQIRELKPTTSLIKVLDLCAAPGGKSILMEAALPEQSMILCNEIIASRYKVLRHNLDKWGSTRTYSSQHAPEDLEPLGQYFDLILVDAPCSGEGMIRKSEAVLQSWSEKSVAGCALRQQSILSTAKSLLRPGGILIYSTCTYNPSENIDNAIWLQQNGFQNIPLGIPSEWNIVTVEKKDVKGYQFFPHRVRGEGFFLSCFEKENDNDIESAQIPSAPSRPKKNKKKKHSTFNKKKAFWTILPSSEQSIVEPWLAKPEEYTIFQNPTGLLKIILKAHEEEAQLLESALRQKAIGILIGNLKGKHFIPSHQLALSNAIAPDLPALSLTKEQALSFLKKETFELPAKASGWTLMQYEKVNLGWIKALPNRFNNYLPNHFRI